MYFRQSVRKTCYIVMRMRMRICIVICICMFMCMGAA